MRNQIQQRGELSRLPALAGQRSACNGRLGEAYAQAALGYVGTPWRHQARVKGLGVDCVGVLVCAARDVGLTIKDVTNYPTQPSGNWLVNELRAQLLPVERADMQPGDVLCFQWGGTPWHVGVLTDLEPLSMVHAWRQVDRCAHMRLDESWGRRICSVWRFPEADQ